MSNFLVLKVPTKDLEHKVVLRRFTFPTREMSVVVRSGQGDFIIYPYGDVKHATSTINAFVSARWPTDPTYDLREFTELAVEEALPNNKAEFKQTLKLFLADVSIQHDYTEYELEKVLDKINNDI